MVGNGSRVFAHLTDFVEFDLPGYDFTIPFEIVGVLREI